MKLALLASAAALGLSGAAFAQDAAPPKSDNAAPQAEAKAGNAAPQAQANANANSAVAAVTDEEVQRVAALAADVKQLNTAHQPKISGAADAEAKAAAQKELDTSIQAALTKHGLTVDRYNEIARAAQADTALAARISAASTASTGTATPSSAAEPARD